MNTMDKAEMEVLIIDQLTQWEHPDPPVGAEQLMEIFELYEKELLKKIMELFK